jgi:hypothetical protein
MSHLKTKAVLILTLIAISFSAFAQAPNLLNYQGVARNSVGNPIANQKMNLRLSVHNLSATGTIVYTETREITTNLGGLFSVQVGSAGTTSTTGTIGGISWLSGDKYLQVEIDPANNSKFFDIGVVQLVSVPYAFNAVTAANALTVTTNANLTGAVTSSGNQTSIANGAITSDMIGTLNKSKVGLDLVNNTTDAAKPISTATQVALDTKVDKVAGKDLTTNDYTTDEKTKLASITGTNTGDQINITGNAATATKLITTKNINGVPFDGSTDITIPIIANAEALTGTTLNSTVTASSLTSVGTISSGTISLTTNIKTSGTITAGAVTYPSAHGTGGQVLSTTGTGTLTWTTASGGGVSSIGAISGTSTAKGASITSGVLSLAPANATNGGIVTTGEQVFAGNKTFSNLINGVSVGAYLGVSNTMLGNNAFSSSTPGVNNTALGYKALSNAIGGNDNTAIGANALSGRGSALANGWRNTAVGVDALKNGGGGADNVAIGFLTLPNTSGGANTAVGMYALLSNTSATANVAVGAYAQYGTTDGINNTSIGTASMALNASGAQNTVMGANAIEKNISGSNNTVLGFSAGKYFSNLVSSSTENSYLNNSVLIGASSRTLALNSINEVVIGYNAVGNGSNTIQLGNTDISNVKTSGTITAGTITYPNTSGSINQVLTTNGSGTASWATVAAANAAAGTLTGTTLNSTVTGSSLTSVGTLTSATINGKVIVGASSAASSSAVLEASSTTQGFLPPRMTYAQKTAIVSPSQGLIIYCTNCGANGEVEVYNGAAWTHISGSSAAAIVVIPEVTSLTGRIWMDRNLGASQVATSSTDAASYGDLYQWGRGKDGHEKRSSSTIFIPSISDAPGHGNFIAQAPASTFQEMMNQSGDWRDTKNDNLWQAVSLINNPCPSGFRLPTNSEWETERLSWSPRNAAGAFASPLKLPLAGIRDWSDGSINWIGTASSIWSSTASGTKSNDLGFSSGAAAMETNARAHGMSVRCIKD